MGILFYLLTPLPDPLSFVTSDGALSVGLLRGLLCRQILPDGYCLCSCLESKPEPILGSSQLGGSVPTWWLKPKPLL